VLVIVFVGRDPTPDDRGLRVKFLGRGKHHGPGHLVPDLDLERRPRADEGRCPGDERGDRAGHVHADELDVLVGIDAVGLEGRMQEDVRGGTFDGRHFLPFNVFDALGPGFRAGKQHGRVVLDVVDQEDLTHPAGGEVGDDGTHDRHIHTASAERLHQRNAGGEHNRLQLHTLFFEVALVDCQPHLAIHR